MSAYLSEIKQSNLDRWIDIERQRLTAGLGRRNPSEDEEDGGAGARVRCGRRLRDTGMDRRCPARRGESDGGHGGIGLPLWWWLGLGGAQSPRVLYGELDSARPSRGERAREIEEVKANRTEAKQVAGPHRRWRNGLPDILQVEAVASSRTSSLAAERARERGEWRVGGPKL